MHRTTALFAALLALPVAAQLTPRQYYRTQDVQRATILDAAPVRWYNGEPVELSLAMTRGAAAYTNANGQIAAWVWAGAYDTNQYLLATGSVSAAAIALSAGESRTALPSATNGWTWVEIWQAPVGATTNIIGVVWRARLETMARYPTSDATWTNTPLLFRVDALSNEAALRLAGDIAGSNNTAAALVTAESYADAAASSALSASRAFIGATSVVLRAEWQAADLILAGGLSALSNASAGAATDLTARATANAANATGAVHTAAIAALYASNYVDRVGATNGMAAIGDLGNYLPKSGGTMTGSIVLTTNGTARAGITYDAPGSLTGAPWRTKVQSSSTLNHDTMYRALYNADIDIFGAVSRTVSGEHVVSMDYEGRWTGGDPLADRGVFEWNLNIDPATNGVVTFKRPWTYYYYLTPPYHAVWSFGDAADTGNVFTVNGSEVIYDQTQNTSLRIRAAPTQAARLLLITAGDGTEWVQVNSSGTMILANPLQADGSQLTGVTAAQVGAVATNATRYLATITNATGTVYSNAAIWIGPAASQTTTNANVLYFTW